MSFSYKIIHAMWPLLFLVSCVDDKNNNYEVIQHVNGTDTLEFNQIWLSHEHTLVDFIGADLIDSSAWNDDSVIQIMLPHFEDIKKYEVAYFVDCTPNYLGRDPLLLKRLSDLTGIKILTNTGLYGARKNHFIPSYAKEMSPEQLADLWVKEFTDGIEGTSIKPGFIKIGVDALSPLDNIHQKLVKAAALTHLKTGLTIASHTGQAVAFWPQAEIIRQMDVSPKAFIWVHAQFEKDNNHYLKAAKEGYWISLDGLGWEFDNHLKKLLFAKENDILDHILISHDAGWYDPQKEKQSIKPYTAIFKKLIPKLKNQGFSESEIKQLIRINPAKAYAIQVRSIDKAN